MDDKQGLLSKSEKEESLYPPFKSLLRRQTATAQLMSPIQAPADAPGQVKHSPVEQQDEVRGGAFHSKANGYSSRSATRPEQDSPVEQNGSLHVPAELGLDSLKVGGPEVRHVVLN